MQQPILELQNLPHFSERCDVLDIAAVHEDDRFGKIREILAIWDKAAGAVPDRRDLDPLHLRPTLLPLLVMMDVVDGGADFCWRLFGSRHAVEFGADLTGKCLSQLRPPDEETNDFKQILQAVAAEGRPIPFELTYLSQSDILRQSVGLFMPMRNGGHETTILLGATDWVAGG